MSLVFEFERSGTLNWFRDLFTYITDMIFPSKVLVNIHPKKTSSVTLS